MKKLKNKLMRRYALTEKGADDFIKCALITALQNICLMMPVSILYLVAKDLYYSSLTVTKSVVYAVWCVALLAVMWIVYFFQYNAAFFSTYKESENRRINLAERLRHLPLSYFSKKDLSDLTSTLLSDCTALESGFSHYVPQFFGAIISTVIVAIGLLCFDVKMGIAALWVLPIALVIVICSRRVQNRASKKKLTAQLSQEESIQEYFEAIKDLKSYNAEDKYLERLTGDIKRLERASIVSELVTGLYVVSASCLLRLGIGTVALAGSALLCAGKLDVMTFFVFILAVSRLYEPMQGSLMNLAAVISLDVNIERMNEITDYGIQGGTEDLNVSGYDIRFDDVGFSYEHNHENSESESGEAVLRGVTFTAKRGEITALVGPSGGGKSTVSKLAARFWDADNGSITIGGKNINEIDPEKLLSAYSIVFQDVTLFNNTVMENIRIGKNGATDEEVLRAAKLANCDEFVSRLENGYQTDIGENGCELSGGERQRISIARAFLKDAPIILLDEATASLDVENETLIQSALSRLIENKTVLVIAHRMRTVAGADKIVVIKDGKSIEQGSPDELMARGGVFRRMVELQSGS